MNISRTIFSIFGVFFIGLTVAHAQMMIYQPASASESTKASLPVEASQSYTGKQMMERLIRMAKDFFPERADLEKEFGFTFKLREDDDNTIISYEGFAGKPFNQGWRPNIGYDYSRSDFYRHDKNVKDIIMYFPNSGFDFCISDELMREGLINDGWVEKIRRLGGGRDDPYFSLTHFDTERRIIMMDKKYSSYPCVTYFQLKEIR
jgi:hypothetical protein